MRICFICTEYPPSSHGGIGTVTQTLARGLVRLGSQVSVVGVGNDNEPETSLDEGVQVFRLKRSTLRKIRSFQARYCVYQAIAAWVRENKIDVVEAPDYEGWIAGWPPLPVPVVTRLHGSASYFAVETGRPINKILFQLERMALRRASFYCSTSQYAANRTKEVFRLQALDASVLYNPVEVSPYDWSPNPREQSVVFSGTLTPKKGVIPLIAAWRKVVIACPDARLHLYGRDGRANDGTSMQGYLLSQLSPELRNTVCFHGEVSRDVLFAALRSAWAAVFPSFSEAFGVAPLEAMAQGCPTIFSRMSSGPELITDSIDGLLVNPCNEEEIVNAIRHILERKDAAAKLSVSGWRKVRNAFSVDQLLSKNILFYRTCVQNFN